MRLTSVIARSIPFALLAACSQDPTAAAQGPAQASPQPESMEGVVRAETVAEGLVHPWALAFLPDGRLLVTERPGRLRIVSMDGTLSPPLTGVRPQATHLPVFYSDKWIAEVC